MARGIVYLVGAGPGDSGLLTVKGKELLEQAEVVVYDRLVNPRLLDFVPPPAELIYVGKSPQRHTLSQEEINALLVTKAGEGKKVVRLKGGDPFIFGRGGEEVVALAAAGISFEVVPGITSPVAAAAYAGIPLTHRELTSSVAFITGNEEPDKPASQVDWEKVVTGIGTLVFLMGMHNLSQIVEQLLRHGRDPRTPVAVIYRGTTADQRTVTGEVREIAARVEEARLANPAVIIVGEVARLREQLAWAERRPLFGRRIVVTRARHQAGVLAARLEALGGEVVEFPVIALEPPDDNYQALDRAIEAIDTYDWLLFTSANGVDLFFRRFLAAHGKDIRELGGIHLGAIGPQTAAALRQRGLQVAAQATEFRQEGLTEALLAQDIAGCRVLLARAQEARDALPDALQAAGAEVVTVAGYRTVPARDQRYDLLGALREKKIHAVTFTSSSTVRNFISILGEANLNLLTGMILASIGPLTTRTLEDAGLSPQVEAATYTIPGLVEALERYFTECDENHPAGRELVL